MTELLESAWHLCRKFVYSVCSFYTNHTKKVSFEIFNITNYPCVQSHIFNIHSTSKSLLSVSYMYVYLRWSYSVPWQKRKQDSANLIDGRIPMTELLESAWHLCRKFVYSVCSFYTNHTKKVSFEIFNSTNYPCVQ